MSEIITQESDPVLWQSLYDRFNSEGNPRNVTKGYFLYSVFYLAGFMDTIAFKQIDTLEYLDSRSLKGSRPASYNKLMGGNVD